jgi:hypothetical protein
VLALVVLVVVVVAVIVVVVAATVVVVVVAVVVVGPVVVVVVGPVVVVVASPAVVVVVAAVGVVVVVVVVDEGDDEVDAVDVMVVELLDEASRRFFSTPLPSKNSCRICLASALRFLSSAACDIAFTANSETPSKSSADVAPKLSSNHLVALCKTSKRLPENIFCRAPRGVSSVFI